MARMRVHELAKELNVNNKDLIERIVKLGIQVKNHMSTLNDSSIQKVRQHFGGARPEAVEEKRIGRTVIRRRKKASEEPVPESPETGEGLVAVDFPPPAPSAESAPSPPAEPPSEWRDALQEAPSSEALPREAAPVSSALEKPSEGPPSQEAPPSLEEVPVSEDLASGEAVSPGPSVEPPAEAAEPGGAVAVEASTGMEEPEAAGALEEVDAVGEELEEDEDAVGEEVAEGVEAGEALPPEEGAEEVEDDEKAKSKARKAKKRRRKKARKDEPARIIKLPDIIPAEPEEEPELPSVVSRLGIKDEEEPGRVPGRKKMARPEEEEREAAKGKRRSGGRRKEVVGKEDLYTPGELAAQAGRRTAGGRARGASVKEAPRQEAPAAPKVGKRKIKIDEAITLANLAKQMGIKAGEVIKRLLLLGFPANINQAVDFDTAALLASEFDFEVERVGFEEENVLQSQEDRAEDLVPRPPVITVMGHVDHGKTSLLDAIRHTNVIEGESGGITQHIGAYYVKGKTGDVVFLDTPGHEAFTAMRARGAKVTDIVILVVAADDGVMQQTVEAINHARAAEVPIIVAINKIDKANANLDRVKRELAEHGLLTGEWGGDATMVEVSAKKGIGIDELLEMALLQAEIMELKANPRKAARGRVIEARLDKGRGAVATVLIQEGTLKTGDAYVCGLSSGRVRNMFNDRGRPMEEAAPSTPVEVSGFSAVPNAGEDFIVLEDEKRAKQVAEHRQRKQREKELTRTSKVSLESLFQQIQEGEIKEVNVIVKTDVQGSLEAITDALAKLATSEVKVSLIHSGTGAITETDVMLASASNAIVVGFSVRADAKVQELAQQENVEIRYYDIIYQLIGDVKDAMVGMLEPVFKEHVTGRVEVRQTFHISKIGTVAGSYVLDGKVERGSRVRVLRDQVVVYDGRMSSLKRFKEDAKEVRAGFECGISVENYNDLKIGDILEAYELQEVKPELSIDEN